MKRQLLALAACSALALGSTFTLLAGEPEPGRGPGYGEHHGGMRGHGPGPMGGNPLEHLTRELNLTEQQKTQVAPIVEQAKPQIKAIHEEAMQKMHAVMENATAQIRPLLTAEQQTKLDAMKKAHEDEMKAHQEMDQAKAK